MKPTLKLKSNQPNFHGLRSLISIDTLVTNYVKNTLVSLKKEKKEKPMTRNEISLNVNVVSQKYEAPLRLSILRSIGPNKRNSTERIGLAPPIAGQSLCHVNYSLQI